MHERNVDGQRLAEDEPERRPEEQRSTKMRAAANARQRCPVETG
jgi:hypothetical protein